MLVSQVLKEKGDLVFTVAPDDSAAEAAAVLHERQVGAAVVLGPGGGVIGIFSERDLVRLIALQGAEGLKRSVCDCMTRQVIFAAPDETIDSVMARMTDRRVRHLPVLKDGRLTGIVSIGDMVKRKIAETEFERESLKAYIAA